MKCKPVSRAVEVSMMVGDLEAFDRASELDDAD